MYQLNPLLETTVARRLLDSGKLSLKDIMRLRRAHMVPTKKQFIDGVNRGTDNMLKKMGVKVTPNTDPLNSYSTRGFIHNKQTEVSIPNSIDRVTNMNGTQFSPTQIAIIRRHEAREAARGKSSFKSFLDRMRKLNIDKKNKLNAADKSILSSEDILGHNTGVLSDEGKLANQLRNRYGIRTRNKTSGGLILGIGHSNIPKKTNRLIRSSGDGLLDLSAKDESNIKKQVSMIIKDNPEEYSTPSSIESLYRYLINDLRVKRGLKPTKY